MPYVESVLVYLQSGAQPTGKPRRACAGVGGVLASSIIGSSNGAYKVCVVWYVARQCVPRECHISHLSFLEPSCTVDASRRHPNVVSSLHFAQVLSGGGPGGQSAELAAAPGAISAQVNRLAPATPAAVLCPRGSQRAAANVYSR